MQRSFKKGFVPALFFLASFFSCGFSQEQEDPVKEIWIDNDPYRDPTERWAFSFKPGYFWFANREMAEFFNEGAFSFRGEFAYQLWGPLNIWVDGGYLQKRGESIGGTAMSGTDRLDLKLASLTLGLKVFFPFSSWFFPYLGAGPRLFMMMLDNHSDHVPAEDNEIGIGGGLDAGVYLYPVSYWPHFFLDLFADYSWKRFAIESSGLASLDNDIDVSGLLIGLGLGWKF